MTIIILFLTVDWPHTQWIFDFIRCSVSFDSVDDMVKGCMKFEEIINGMIAKKSQEQVKANTSASYYGQFVLNPSGNSGDGFCMFNDIIRIKNGFKNIKNESWKCKYSEFGYVDIKYNILLDGGVARKDKGLKNIVAEVQFLVNFMKKAKHLGHAIYSFCRKEDLFKSINKQVNVSYGNNGDGSGDDSSDDGLSNELKKMIFTHNLSQFSLYLELCNDNQRKYILKNKEKLTKFIKENKWQRGLKLIQEYV